MEKRELYNRKRSNIISVLKRKNLRLAEQISAYISQNTLEQGMIDHLARLSRSVSKCATLSLYSQSRKDNSKKYIASHLCDNKNCFICNYAREKAIRRKYMKFFRENETIITITDGKKSKIVTQGQFINKYTPAGWIEVKREKYDLMHLTLTVTHSDEGFRGNKYYYPDFISIFNIMRKYPDFSNWVLGGEYGVETTRNGENGLHIHMHSLLLVRQGNYNRNETHKIILHRWNNLTIDENAKRKLFTRNEIDAICKGNKMMSPEWVIKKLDPRGSTFINLDGIYEWENGKRKYISDINSPQMLSAVMETIKYHFEPTAFDKKNKTFDLPLLADILPAVFKQKLYDKFGCLHGEKSLNVKSKVEDEFSEVSEMLVDENTGELFYDNDFFIVNPAMVYHNPEKKYELVLSKKADQNKQAIMANTSREAVIKMGKLKKVYNSKTA